MACVKQMSVNGKQLNLHLSKEFLDHTKNIKKKESQIYNLKISISFCRFKFNNKKTKIF